MENKKTQSNNKFATDLKRLGKAGYWLVGILLVAIAVLTISSVLGFPEKLQVFVVQSGSMEPAIRTGSIAIVEPVEEYSESDIITFTSASNPDNTITHRITGKEETDGEEVFTTQGDANESADTNPVNKESVIGKVIFSVPYIGYPVAFAKTEIGFILLIVIPATLIIYNEIIVIKKEAKHILEKRKAKKSKVAEHSNIINLKEKHEKNI